MPYKDPTIYTPGDGKVNPYAVLCLVREVVATLDVPTSSCYDLDDIVQEVALWLVWDITKTLKRGKIPAKRWLFKVARDKAVAFIKRNGTSIPLPAIDPPSYDENEDDLGELKKYLNLLDPQVQEILCHYYGLFGTYRIKNIVVLAKLYKSDAQQMRKIIDGALRIMTSAAKDKYV